MQLWLSAEVHHDVSDGLRQAEQKVKRTINARLIGEYGPDVDEWAFITILRPQIPEGWGEIGRYHAKRRVVEFRLIIDYETFKSANREEQVGILFRSILRSLDIFADLGMACRFDVARFRRDLMEIGISEHWVKEKIPADN
jgi:hypothetical protein